MNNDDCLGRFLQSLMSERFVSTNTSAAYSSDLRDLCQFLTQQELTIVDASFDDLHRYVKSLTARGYSPATVTRRISAIRALFRFLCADRILSEDPSLSLDSCKLGRSLPRVLTTSEIDALLSSSDLSPQGRRLSAIVNVLYSSGVRVSELIHLGFYEIEAMLKEQNLEVGHVVIKGKSGRERLVLFNRVAMDSLRMYIEVRTRFIVRKNVQSKWLFPGARFDQCLSRQRVGHLIKSLAVAAGVDVRKVSPHKLRHSFATHLLNSGSNIVFIQKMLGHASLSTTQVYTYVASDKLRETLKNFHPFSKLNRG